MITEYEINNVLLANCHTKSRKILELNNMSQSCNEGRDALAIKAVKKSILGKETEKQVLDRFEEEDRIQWIEYYARAAASDLLTLGKVQPETMLAMSAVPEDDFSEIVKRATTRANALNKITIATEKELNLDLISNEMI